MDDRQFEERVKQLAATLKAQGIAASETRAREMAADIVRTERKQLADHERKRFDPDVNPQQRVVNAAIQRVEQHAQRINVEGADANTPISDLVAEKAPEPTPIPTTEPKQAAPQPTPEPAPQPAPQPAPTPKPEPTPTPEPVPQAAPAPQPAPTPPAPEEREPLATGAKEIQSQPSPKKPQQEKVDLNEMFNFAKRKN